jgi:hypothetical protein
VERGGSISFTFSAKNGYYLSSVTVDGTALTQDKINLGRYTFTNVAMNHSIVVNSSPTSGRTDTLEINLDDINGYIEYSLDGGKTFERYTGAVIIPPSSDVVLRAYPNDGYVFEKWETPAVVTTSETTIGAGSLANVKVFFAESGNGNVNGNGSDWPILNILCVIIVIIIVIIALVWIIRHFWKNDEEKRW